MVKHNYPISDVWLQTQDENAPAYCDIEEIRLDPANRSVQPGNALNQPTDHPSSAYLTWVLENDPKVFTLLDGGTPTRKDHINAANFIDCGSRVSDVDDGNNIKGVLGDSLIITTGEFFGGTDHNEIYRRIYRDGTEVEKFWFLGC